MGSAGTAAVLQCFDISMGSAGTAAVLQCFDISMNSQNPPQCSGVLSRVVLGSYPGSYQFSPKNFFRLGFIIKLYFQLISYLIRDGLYICCLNLFQALLILISFWKLAFLNFNWKINSMFKLLLGHQYLVQFCNVFY